MLVPGCVDGTTINSVIGLYVQDTSVQIGLQYLYHDLPVVITVPVCGTQVIYKNKHCVPNMNIRCPCGDPSHWLIRLDPIENVR